MKRREKVLNPNGLIHGRVYEKFHNEPDRTTQRKGYLIVGQRFLGKAIKNGFVYAEYTNTEGILTNGWIKFSDVLKE